VLQISIVVFRVSGAVRVPTFRRNLSPSSSGRSSFGPTSYEGDRSVVKAALSRIKNE
jgi:hypothetical protein